MHILETSMETNLDFDPHADQPSWVFPGELVELNTPENGVLFREEPEELGTQNEQQQTGEDLAIGGELQENRDNIHQRLSPPERYIPGGAEGSDSSQSSLTTEGEETVEEGLA